MKKYLVKSSTTMKHYNSKNYWIMSDIIPSLEIVADSINDLLIKFQERVTDYGITISNNALKNKEPIYYNTRDGETRQDGYLLTGSTEIYDRSANIAGVKQYVDVWTSIHVIESPFEIIEV